MHPSLAYHQTPPDKRPYVPSVRGFRPTGHRTDLGYIPSEGVGPRPDPLPMPLGEPMHHSLEPRACPDGKYVLGAQRRGWTRD